MVEPVKGSARVMYVPQGFESLDAGIIEALKQITGELRVVPASEMLAAGLSFRPDLVLVLNALHVFPPDHAAHLDQLRAAGIRTAVWFVDDPYFTEYTVSLAPHYDYVFTHEFSCVPFYEAAGSSRVYHLPLAADTAFFSPDQVPPAYQYDICFIGNAFWNRVALFDELAPYLAGKRVLIGGAFWERLGRKDILGPFIREGWIAPAETRLYYNGAKIVINLHRPTEQGQDNHNTAGLPGCSVNPRTYEIAACGALQLTDVREELSQLYRPGFDIETFGSAVELKEKLEYYLTNERQRAELAWRGLWTTRTRHTYIDRLGRLLATVL